MQVPNDFGFRDEHALLRREARRFLADHAGPEAFRTLATDARGHDPEVLRAMAALGWAGLVLPEVHGGAGLGWLHLVLLLEEQGRALLCSPLLATLLAGVAIDLAGDETQRATVLPALASGERMAALAWSEPHGSWEPEAVQATVGEDRAVGIKTHVVAGSDADLLVVPLCSAEGVGLYLVEAGAPGVRIEPESNVDLTRRTARIVLDGAPAQRLGHGDLDALRRVLVRAWVMLAAEGLGTHEAAMSTTRDYANLREQFRRKIGSFQAVSHPIVDMLVGGEQARSLVYAAAAALDADSDDAPVLARMAKAATSDALAFAVRKAVQLHGGIGFTWECDVHFYFRRAMWLRATLGDARHHRRHLRSVMLERLG